ncbi:MAG: hypothetical protein ACFCD0_13755 [Gemmataceae bacterium]
MSAYKLGLDALQEHVQEHVAKVGQCVLVRKKAREGWKLALDISNSTFPLE